jgi:hypothetical protein
MSQTAGRITHTDERYAERCRRSLRVEQARSLAETDGWAHVDKDRVHADWDALYSEIAGCLDGARPEDDRAQELIERHFAIASRFYAPSREAYIGMAMLYSEDAAMREFHNAYHPRMVDFLGPAMRAYADKRLDSSPAAPDAGVAGDRIHGPRVEPGGRS